MSHLYLTICARIVSWCVLATNCQSGPGVCCFVLPLAALSSHLSDHPFIYIIIFVQYCVKILFLFNLFDSIQCKYLLRIKFVLYGLNLRFKRLFQEFQWISETFQHIVWFYKIFTDHFIWCTQNLQLKLLLIDFFFMKMIFQKVQVFSEYL